MERGGMRHNRGTGGAVLPEARLGRLKGLAWVVLGLLFLSLAPAVQAQEEASEAPTEGEAETEAPAAVALSPFDQPDPEAHRYCLDPVQRIERDYGLEPGLLAAIGMAESGRRVVTTREWAPWPWTINAAGQGLYFETRAEAIATIQTLMRQGVTNIDIGCMQISLFWHNLRFETLEDIIDPVKNLTYAAEYLSSLYRQHGNSWTEAIGHYHSSDYQRRTSYTRRVMGYWRGGAPLDGGGVIGVAEPETPMVRASQAYQQGEFVAALATYREQLALNPDDRTARVALAMTLDRLGREAEALEAWRAVLVLTPNHPQATARLISHARSQPTALALGLAREVRRLAPSNADAALYLAEVLTALGEPEEALGLALVATRLDPTHPLPWLNAAILLDRSGQGAAALIHYATFLERYHAAPLDQDVPIRQIRARMDHLRMQRGG